MGALNALSDLVVFIEEHEGVSEACAFEGEDVVEGHGKVEQPDSPVPEEDAEDAEAYLHDSFYSCVLLEVISEIKGLDKAMIQIFMGKHEKEDDARLYKTAYEKEKIEDIFDHYIFTIKGIIVRLCL